ncbi:hypothetical protein HT102_13530 [Hoyosella sp. G463]|uniref:Uncharacterized protein n=1 Tax=Lolliginicoccus lacisalsi TaxID=2742202 RepID=A0A927JDT8_9ACTN|nr:hypothetical protein [Lolliginicoccus lacisalsi]MBD8507504.1 hypothetical protein [Lolliginicoccus lacisalsi]
MANPPGVVCFEGEWEGFESPVTIRPSLELLENLNAIRFVHRNATTKDELRHNLDRWLSSRKQGYDFCYLAYHGSPGELDLVNSERADEDMEGLALEDLADMLGTRAEGKILHFGSCAVLSVPDDRLVDFCRRTKVRAISGYTRQIDWVDSAAFEIIAIETLCTAKKLRPAYNRLYGDHPVLAKRLGFKMATAKWVDDH